MGGKMENIYHVDDRYSNFLEEQVKELKAEKSQSFWAIYLELLQAAGGGLGMGN